MLVRKMHEIAYKYKWTPMLGHTHGQPATPLTFGHAMAVDAYRLYESMCHLSELPIKGKFNGAVGNMAAISTAYPDKAWLNFSYDFVTEGMGFHYNPLTSQIENHDYMVRIFNEMRLFTDVVENISQNLWDYISRGYLKQKTKPGEVGSSTMPQKTNPIDSENAWSNAETVAYASIDLTRKLPFSRMQRDLSDSSTQRTIANLFMHSYQAVVSLEKMLDKIDVNEEVMLKDLEAHPEVLAEMIQTVMRANGYTDAYEVMKDMTKGKSVTLEELRMFIIGLDIKKEDKEKLLKLESKDAIGYSSDIVTLLLDVEVF